MGSRRDGGKAGGQMLASIPWCFNEAIRAPGFEMISARGGSRVDSLAQPPHFTRAEIEVPRGENDLLRVTVSSRKGLEPRSLPSYSSVSSKV